MRLLYNGADLAGLAEVASCTLDMYADGQSDSLQISFADDGGLWGRWSPQPGDYLYASEGAADSGKMHITAAIPEAGILALRALAAPATFFPAKSRSWENVTLMHLIKDIADANGLAYETYGIGDWTYRHVRQSDISDSAFISRRLAAEGAAMLVHDGKLICYSVQEIEKADPALAIAVTGGVKRRLCDNRQRACSSLRIEAGAYAGEHDTGILPGVKLVTSDSGLDVSSDPEARRFAAGLAFEHNKDLLGGVVWAGWEPGLAPGSMINIKTEDWPLFDGPAFIARVRHDLTGQKTKLWFRKAISEWPVNENREAGI